MAAKGWHFGRDGPIFPQRFPKAVGSEFVPIVHLYKMSSMESGSLTQKDRAISSLTASDLQNHKITLFSSSGKGPVGFLWTQKILVWGRVELLKFETLTHSIVGIISLTISKNHLIVTVIVVT